MALDVMPAAAQPFDLEDMSLTEWDGFHDEHKHELVEGVLVMSPTETFWNRRTVSRLADLVSRAGGPVEWATDVEVLLDPGPRRPTVRCPDLVVVRAGEVEDVPRLAPDEVVLAVEVVSPGSRETDWVTKRAAYAAAGIPAYLVVDRHRGRLALFDRPADGHYERETTDEVTLDLAGTPLRLRLGDIVD